MRHEQFLSFMQDVAGMDQFRISDLDLFIGRFNSAVQSMTSLMGFRLFAGSTNEEKRLASTR
jgi:hypothetical protein